MRIEKRDYSASPWRLVTADGKEVLLKMPFEHPSLGWTVVEIPVCGKTKTEVIDKTLLLFGQMLFKEKLDV